MANFLTTTVTQDNYNTIVKVNPPSFNPLDLRFKKIINVGTLTDTFTDNEVPNLKYIKSLIPTTGGTINLDPLDMKNKKIINVGGINETFTDYEVPNLIYIKNLFGALTNLNKVNLDPLDMKNKKIVNVGELNVNFFTDDLDAINKFYVDVNNRDIRNDLEDLMNNKLAGLKQQLFNDNPMKPVMFTLIKFSGEKSIPIPNNIDITIHTYFIINFQLDEFSRTELFLINELGETRRYQRYNRRQDITLDDWFIEIRYSSSTKSVNVKIEFRDLLGTPTLDNNSTNHIKSIYLL